MTTFKERLKIVLEGRFNHKAEIVKLSADTGNIRYAFECLGRIEEDNDILEEFCNSDRERLFAIGDLYQYIEDKEKELLEMHEITAKKKIYNPVTGTYYDVKLRSSKYGKGGEIKGLWVKELR